MDEYAEVLVYALAYLLMYEASLYGGGGGFGSQKDKSHYNRPRG